MKAAWRCGRLEHVKALLHAQRAITVQLLGMTTKGDQILDRTLSKVGGKGLFVKELEVALEEGRAHIAVHSLKDVPMDLPDGFALACVMEREDPRDAFVSPHYAEPGRALPQGAVVGTSSLRRQVLLQALRPDLKIEPLRGNLDTRLRKLDEGQYDAIVLAAAGLKRLSMTDAHPQHLRAHRHAARRGPGRPGHRDSHRLARTWRMAIGTAGPHAHLAARGRRACRQPRHGGQLLGAAGRPCRAGAGQMRLRCRLGRP